MIASEVSIQIMTNDVSRLPFQKTGFHLDAIHEPRLVRNFFSLLTIMIDQTHHAIGRLPIKFKLIRFVKDKLILSPKNKDFYQF